VKSDNPADGYFLSLCR